MHLLVGLAGAIALAAPGVVLAHSILLEASPAAGTTVRAPARVSLRFNNRIEKPLSRIRLVGEGGERHDLRVTLNDGPPDRLTAAAPALTPGRYRLEWQVLSTDGHVVSGGFPFHVAP